MSEASQTTAQKIDLIFFPAESANNDALKEFYGAAQKNPQFDVLLIDDPKAAFEQLASSGGGLILFAVKNANELPGLVQLLTLCKGLIANRQVRSTGFNLTGLPSNQKTLMKNGVSEVMERAVTLRALQHKLQRWAALVLNAKQLHLKNSTRSSETQVHVKSKQAAENSAPVSLPVHWESPMDSPSDCWIVKKSTDVRSIRSTWMVELVGPGPSIGKWEPFQIQGHPANSCWVWTSRGGVDPFLLEPGKWFFFGRQPEFSWKSKLWQFVSDVPKFVFVADAGGEKSRFEFNATAGALKICKNSQHAMKHLPALISTIEKDAKTMAPDQLEGSTDKNASVRFDTSEDAPSHPWNDPKSEFFIETDAKIRDDVDESNPAGSVAALEEEMEENGPAIRDDWQVFHDSIGLSIAIQVHGIDAPASFLDWFDPELTLTISSGLVSVNDPIDVHLKTTLSKEKLDFRAKGVCKINDNSPDGQDIVTIEMKEYVASDFEKFVGVFAERQSSVNLFMKKAKGF